MENGIDLSRLPPSGKALVTCFVVAIGIGYGVSLLQVGERGSFRTRTTVEHFRGSADSGSEMNLSLPQTNATLVSVAHVHTFSQPMVIGLMSVLFVLAKGRERSKVFWIILAFAGSMAMNASPWLIRDASPLFVVLLYFGGVSMMAAYVVMAVRILSDVWGLRRN